MEIMIVLLCLVLVIQSWRVVKLSRKNQEQEHTIANLMYVANEQGSMIVHRDPKGYMVYEPGSSASCAYTWNDPRKVKEYIPHYTPQIFKENK